MASREQLLAKTFVDIADTLVADFDVLEFLSVLATRCVEIFGAAEAGLMLTDASGRLQVASSSSHKMRVLELLEIQLDEGPCVESFQTGTQVRCDDLAVAIDRWPRFGPDALDAGFTAVYSVPMRLRDQVIGSLNLLRTDPGPLEDDDLAAAQALADVATIGILQHRAASESRLVAEQLQYALNSRVIIEQAKGVLAERHSVDLEDAFAALRRYARDHNLRLIDVAHSVVAREVPDDAFAPGQISAG